MTAPPPALLITTGEPAGIGPDITLQLATQPLDARLSVLGDPQLLAARCQDLGLTVTLRQLAPEQAPARHEPGFLQVIAEPLAAPVTSGAPNPANAAYVLHLLERGAALASALGPYDALITAPVQKSTINEAGMPFSGHTEYLAQLTGASRPVMLLVSDALRVALLTTHLPLTAVPAAVTDERLIETVTVLHRGLTHQFGITAPRILVCGLNPHAGEDGHLGHEDRDIIAPALATLRSRGLDVVGPVPADSAFTPGRLNGVAAVLAMYHDQGLPVIKARGFGDIVNVTLGLPLIRTSVDHGTALDLAGTGRASAASLLKAVALAARLVAAGRAS